MFPDPKTGILQIEWREQGRRLTRSLGHREWVRAKRQADESAAGFAGPDLNGKAEAEPEPLTLGELFDIYGEEVTPAKGEKARQGDRAAMAMFLKFSAGAEGRKPCHSGTGTASSGSAGRARSAPVASPWATG